MFRPKTVSIIWAIKKAATTTIRPIRAWVRLLVAVWILAGSPEAVIKAKPARSSLTKKIKPATKMLKSRKREVTKEGRVA